MDAYSYDNYLYMTGATEYHTFNKKLWFQAYDALNEWVEAQENKNKYRCPDQLYAYEQWCPREFQTFYGIVRYNYDIQRNVFDTDYLKSIYREKQDLQSTNYNKSS